jgi:hypothetical protein
MDWSGAPAASFSNAGGTPAANPGLHVTVRNKSNDVGVAAAFARTLSYYAAKEGSSTLGTQAKNTAKGLLDRMLLLKESKGITVSETRGDIPVRIELRRFAWPDGQTLQGLCAL